ncbi:MAG: hypothetical protein J6W75_11515 [Bacteroidaceae bacterium]|nr:hypothetical protein [Bacteroidaceae bacterium]
MEKTFCICHLCLLLLFTCCTGQRERMEQIIHDAKEQNLNYVPFTTDSLLREAVAYYDRHGTANERLLAHYLLGCAYRDMNEAPLAIITWEDAVACADTTATDCDYATLFRVYGQMADVYYRQYLTEKQLESSEKFCRFAQLANDTLNYLRGFLLKNSAYMALGDTLSVLRNIDDARTVYLKYGYFREAAQVYASAIEIAVDACQYDKADSLMGIYETDSGLFDEEGNIAPSRERYYYVKGMYFLGLHNLDSAEIYFRRILTFEAHVIDGYRGLLAVYDKRKNIDSIIKYSTLYEDALVDYLDETTTDAVVQATAMYDYRRQEKAVLLQEHKTHQIRHFLFVTIVGFSLVIFVLVQRYKAKQRKRDWEIKNLLDKYMRAMQDASCKEQELSVLRQHLSTATETVLLMRAKEQEYRQLQSKLSEYEREFSCLKSSEKSSALLNSDIVRLFHQIAEARTVRKGSKVETIQPRKATEEEWCVLQETIRQCLPLFYARITEEGQLTCQEFQVCLLMRLDFRSTDTANLVGTSPSRISNVKKSVNIKLFGKSDSNTLIQSLKKIR